MMARGRGVDSWRTYVRESFRGPVLSCDRLLCTTGEGCENGVAFD
jgi:hypothetical protein